MVAEPIPSHWPAPCAKFDQTPNAMRCWKRLCREIDTRELPLDRDRGILINMIVSSHLLVQDVESKLPTQMDVAKQAVADGFLTKFNNHVSQFLMQLGLPADFMETE